MSERLSGSRCERCKCVTCRCNRSPAASGDASSIPVVCGQPVVECTVPLGQPIQQPQTQPPQAQPEPAVASSLAGAGIARRSFLNAAHASVRNEFPLASARRVADFALQADAAGHASEAIDLYALAVELYSQALARPPAPDDPAAVRRTMGELLSRAEKLKGLPPPTAPPHLPPRPAAAAVPLPGVPASHPSSSSVGDQSI